MKGLELSRAYYEQYGIEMLEKEFPQLMGSIAVGFVGSGSERFGFDDEVSRDHDFEPGFCIFLPGEDIVDSKTQFRLERAYAALPKEFGGIRRQMVSPVGGRRNGVIRTADFYRAAVGEPDGLLSVEQWLHIPDSALAEAVNGEVFFDGLGEFSEIRSRLMAMPRDVKLKRLAGNLLLAAQAGQYNYSRCLKHGEKEASQLACAEFVCSAMKAVFLMHDAYMPYYKWSFKALRNIRGTEYISEKLSAILCETGNKTELVEEVSAAVIHELRRRGLTKDGGTELEKHAYCVNNEIENAEIRNLNILYAI